MNSNQDEANFLLEDARERLEWPRLLQSLASEAVLTSVRTKLESVLPVLPTVEREFCFDATSEMLTALSEGLLFELLDTNIDSFLPLARRSAILPPKELYEVLKLTQMLQAAAGFAKTRSFEGRTRFPCLQSILKGVIEQPRLLSLLSRSVDGSGSILSSASPELDSARKRVETFRRRVVGIVEDLLQSTSVRNALQDPLWMTRDDHIVLPVRADRRSDVAGIPRGVSSTGQTIFIEPQEVLQAQTQLEAAQADALIEENRVIRMLSDEVHAQYENLVAGAEAVSHFDEVLARARFASKIRAVRPVMKPVSECEFRFRLEGARHPLFQVEGRECVPNDLCLEPQFAGDSAKFVWVLTGPNAGGKTVAMRTVGLCALMALSGLFVCADTASLCEFDGVFVELGDRQSREENLSTFSGHLLHVRRILSQVSRSSLVLLDEGFVGTDPAVGMALARGALEYLADREATTIITTHFSNLKLLANEDERFLNASMEFEPRELRPTYRLINGIPGQSFALELAKRIDFPDEILQKAREYYGEESHRMEALLAELQEKRTEIEHEIGAQNTIRQKLKEELESIRFEKRSLAGVRDNLVNEYRNKLGKRLRAFENRLAVRERQFERAQEELREKLEGEARSAQEKEQTAEAVPEVSAAGEHPAANPTAVAKPPTAAKTSGVGSGHANQTQKRTMGSFAELSHLKLPASSSGASTQSHQRNDQVERQAAEFRPPKQMSRRSLEDEARESLDLLQRSFSGLEHDFRAEVGKALKESVAEVSATDSRKTIIVPEETKVPARPAAFWRVGMRVKCARFSEVGEVVRAADGKGMIECKFGFARIKVASAELSTIEEAAKSAHDRGKSSGDRSKSPSRSTHHAHELANAVDTTIESTFQHSGNTVDVRGMTVDEAVEKAERFLDKACRNGEERIIIIHGHGSGRVKAGIREWLVKAQYNLTFRPGVQGEGGDGATVVQFKT